MNSSDSGSKPRKRMKRWERVGVARYLTFSCYRRLPLFSNDAIKQLLVERIESVRGRHDFAMWAWVVMPEHVHMLVMPNLPTCSVSDITRAIKRPVAERVIRRWRELDASVLDRITDTAGRLRFWQPGGGYDRNVVSDKTIRKTIDYIHTNPVRRGLVQQAEDWPWSSARWYAGRDDALIEMDVVQ